LIRGHSRQLLSNSPLTGIRVDLLYGSSGYLHLLVYSFSQLTQCPKFRLQNKEVVYYNLLNWKGIL
jgi:hypothetical protein